MLIPKFSDPEHLGDPYVGAWLLHEAIPAPTAAGVIDEVESSGLVEPIWDLPETNTVNQIFRRLVIDLTREHDFPEVAALGLALSSTVVRQLVRIFPVVTSFVVEEAAVQIYPAGTELALGWHKDHSKDELLVISAVLAGSGSIGFTENTTYDNVTPEDILVEIPTVALDALVFRANGLYTREDGSDIRVPHAVTQIDPDEDRFAIQYRMGVNAGAYGNKHVNGDCPRR